MVARLGRRLRSYEFCRSRTQACQVEDEGGDLVGQFFMGVAIVVVYKHQR